MLDRDGLIRREYDPKPALEEVSFKWTRTDFEELPDKEKEFTDIVSDLSSILSKATDFRSTYESAQRLIERTLGEDTRSLKEVRDLLEQSALIAIGSKVRMEVIALFLERTTIQIEVPIEQERDFIREHGTQDFEKFIASLPERKLRVFDQISSVEQECLDLCPALFDGRMKELRHFAPTLFQYWEIFRGALLEGLHSMTARSLESDAASKKILVGFMLTELEIAAETSHRIDVLINKKSVLHQSKERLRQNANL